MPDGNLRRPPQLWEQKLARTTSVIGLGVAAGDATAIVPSTPTPGTDESVEPAPTTPAPEDFIAPSMPTLSGTVQGIRVSWDGENSNGDPYPAGAFVEVHISTAGATFTPDSTTLAGRLLGSAGFFTIGALTAGTTYYVRLVGVDEVGNRTSPSTAASSQTGLTTSSDYGTATIGSGAVSFNARQIGGITTTVGTTQPSSPVAGDIWLDSSGGGIVHKRWTGSAWVTQAWGSDSISAGAVTAVQVAAGAITAGAIAAGAITADKIQADAITADKIAAGAITASEIAANAITSNKISSDALDSRTITGSVIQTATSGARVIFNESVSGLASISFYNSSGSRVMYMQPGTDRLAFFGNISNLGNTIFTTTLDVASGAKVGGDIEVDGALTDTSTSVPNLRINTSTGVIKQTTHANSAQRFKHDIIALDDTAFGGAVDATRLGDPEDQAVDPFDILDVTPIQFRRNEAPNVVVTGFLAEDVEQKFPTAATYDDDGVLETVDERAIVAALLAVVKHQQTQITDLTARIEALEA